MWQITHVHNIRCKILVFFFLYSRYLIVFFSGTIRELVRYHNASYLDYWDGFFGISTGLWIRVELKRSLLSHRHFQLLVHFRNAFLCGFLLVWLIENVSRKQIPGMVWGFLFWQRGGKLQSRGRQLLIVNWANTC